MTACKRNGKCVDIHTFHFIPHFIETERSENGMETEGIVRINLNAVSLIYI